MKNILAIDPGTHSLGMACFLDGKLVHTATLVAPPNEETTKRIQHIAKFVETMEQEDLDVVVIEDPLLMGKSNNSMQRMIGCLIGQFNTKPISLIHPMTIKKFAGKGTLDKLEVALASGERLSPEEQELLADAIDREAFDETDAIAIGLTYLGNRKDDTKGN